MGLPASALAASALAVDVSAALGGQQDAVDDALVAGAPADVAGERFADLPLVGVGVVVEERGRLHDKPRRAETALEAVRIPHRLLQCAQPAVRGQALDRRYVVAGRLDGQHQARTHRPAVDDDRARTADPVLAADVGAGEIKVIPQEVRQRLARLRRTRARRTVDPQGDAGWSYSHQSLPLAALSAAARRPRRTIAAATVFR